MRILACNPDTIGDVVLRQPMYRALMAEGHELALIVRPLLVPMLANLVPGARVLACDAPLYEPRLNRGSSVLAPAVVQAKEFAPDIMLVAPFQWTVLEERLSHELPSTRTVALTGRLFSDPNYGPARSALRVDVSVPAAEETPEVRKNEMLACAVLGRAVKLPDPAVDVAPGHLAAADAVLAGLGLEPDGYWAACVGDSPTTAVRNWRPEAWAQVLTMWAEQSGKKFLLIGHESESASAAAIRSAMGDSAASAAVWAGRDDGDLEILAGLIARSRGYVGRDTGPMHLAAAMNKPVLAVFGGGTWPRFLPQTDRSVALAVGVPCMGCGWVCHLSRSFCIKDVPVAEVLRAMDDLEHGRSGARETRIVKPDAAMLAQIGREGAASARERLTRLSVTRRENMEQTESLAAVLERALKQAGRAEAVKDELDAATAEFHRREAILKQRLAAAENMFSTREAELQKRIAELEARSARADRVMATESELLGRLARAQEELGTVNSELMRAKAEASDLKLRMERAQTDQGALSKLTKQQQGEVVVLRTRLRQLMESRWRKYGQRLGLCMTMPWERPPSSNGKH